MAVDEILRQAGDFGPAQWCLLSLFSVVNIFSAFHYFAQTFISLTPEEACQVDGFNFTRNDSYVSPVRLEYKWEVETLTSELDWTCENGWKSAVVQSMFFVGSVVGTLVLGILADTFGRIPMLFTANVLAVSGNLFTVYLNPNIWSLAGARFIAGLATDTNFFMMYIIVMEYIKPEMRTFGLNLCIGVWYCIGCMVIPWLAVATRTWRRFLLTVSIPSLLVPVSCFFVPESAQWLLSVGRTDDAVDCFVRLANFNGKKITREFIERFKCRTKKRCLCENSRPNFGVLQGSGQMQTGNNIHVVPKAACQGRKRQQNHGTSFYTSIQNLINKNVSKSKSTPRRCADRMSPGRRPSVPGGKSRLPQSQTAISLNYG